MAEEKLIRNPKLIIGEAEKVETEVVGADDIVVVTDEEFYTSKQIDELLKKSGGASLPILTNIWSDHLLNNMSWLRADTFSWQSGDVYVAAYEHLVGDVEVISYIVSLNSTYYRTPSDDVVINGTQYYAWTTEFGGVLLTTSATPQTSDSAYNRDGTVNIAGIQNFVTYIKGAQTDTIGDITITYYLADDGHKICLPDQESNISALYESAGVAWYYILDTENKQFKLPRTKWGFTGLRDSVGGIAYTGTSGATPDYSSGKTISSGWVAEYDCVGYCDVTQSDGVAGTVYVDGKAVYNHSGGGYPKRNGSQWFVPKGSKVTYSGTWAVSPTVYPLKTVYDKTPATQMYLYFYVGNFEQSAVEQTAGLNAEMFNDLNAHKIIEVQNPTAENGYTWYRKYADGWVEQGGYNSTVSGQVNIVLPIEMSSNVYDIQAHPLVGSNTSDTTTVNRNAAKVYIRMPFNQTTTGFTFPTSADMGQIGTYWQVCGMAA